MDPWAPQDLSTLRCWERWKLWKIAFQICSSLLDGFLESISQLRGQLHKFNHELKEFIVHFFIRQNLPNITIIDKGFPALTWESHKVCPTREQTHLGLQSPKDLISDPVAQLGPTTPISLVVFYAGISAKFLSIPIFFWMWYLNRFRQLKELRIIREIILTDLG